jgi:alanine dehydrogenase
MIIGVPREIKDQEFRVALLPSAAYQLVQRGHQVVVERGAGMGAGFTDAEYQKAGATLVDEHTAVFARSRTNTRSCVPARCSSPISTSPPAGR